MNNPLNESKRHEKLFHISASVGKATVGTDTEFHHIAWINVLSQPSGDRMPGLIGTFEFTTYRSSVRGSNPDMLNTFPDVVCFIFNENMRNQHTASYCATRKLWDDLSAPHDE